MKDIFYSVDVPKILNNGTSLDTEDNDIAHITCSSRADPPPVIRWEKKGVEVKDGDEGVAILSRSNASLEESHLFVAVTSNERRGEYICIATNGKGISKQAFLITGIVLVNRTWGQFNKTTTSVIYKCSSHCFKSLN